MRRAAREGTSTHSAALKCSRAVRGEFGRLAILAVLAERSKEQLALVFIRWQIESHQR